MLVWFQSKPLMGVEAGSRWPWERQFPRRTPKIGEFEFVFDPDAHGYGALVVFGDLPEDEVLVDEGVPRVFVASEPPAFETYSARFLSQFDLVISPDSRSKHPNRVVSHGGNPWHVGMWGSNGTLLAKPRAHDEFSAWKPPKTHGVSLITSAKTSLPGHRARLRFALAVKRHFGKEIDLFGRGIADFSDKAQVLAGYKYHIAIENSRLDHYWTEKLADPFLTLTYPIYYGPANLDEYFPPDAFTAIDIEDLEDAKRKISRVLDEDPYGDALGDLLEARRRVLSTHNLFTIVARHMRGKLDLPALPSRGRKTMLISNRRLRPWTDRLGRGVVRSFGRLSAARQSAVVANLIQEVGTRDSYGDEPATR